MKPNTARFEVLRSCTTQDPKGWNLNLQWGRLIHADREPEWGYRFIYKDNTGALRAQRAGARLDNLQAALDLIAKAKSEGWGDLDATKIAANADVDEVVPPRIRAVLDFDKRLFAGTDRDIVRQMWHASFGTEETASEWMPAAATRARAQTDKPIRDADPTVFLDDLIGADLLTEVSLGGKIAP